jgi:hypothetical protein
MVFGERVAFLVNIQDFRLPPSPGINLNKHTHITNAIFHHWVDLLTVTPGELPDPFEMVPIKVTRAPTLVLHYRAAAAIAGDILQHDATKVLPGDYTTSLLYGNNFHRKFEPA